MKTYVSIGEIMTPEAPCSAPRRQLVNHLDFFRRVLDGTMKLANDQDADCFASWKVGGQDFYVYGTEQNDQAPLED